MRRNRPTRTAVALRKALRDLVPNALDELADSWAIALAEVVGVLAYALGRSELESIAVGVAVLAVRVVMGLVFREKKGRPRRPRARPARDGQIIDQLNAGKSVREVARLFTVPEPYVVRVQREMQPAPKTEKPSSAPGGVPRRHWYEHPLVRGTATAATFLGLAKLLRDELEKAGLI